MATVVFYFPVKLHQFLAFPNRFSFIVKTYLSQQITAPASKTFSTSSWRCLRFWMCLLLIIILLLLRIIIFLKLFRYILNSHIFLLQTITDITSLMIQLKGFNLLIYKNRTVPLMFLAVCSFLPPCVRCCFG